MNNSNISGSSDNKIMMSGNNQDGSSTAIAGNEQDAADIALKEEGGAGSLSEGASNERDTTATITTTTTMNHGSPSPKSCSNSAPSSTNSPSGGSVVRKEPKDEIATDNNSADATEPVTENPASSIEPAAAPAEETATGLFASDSAPTSEEAAKQHTVAQESSESTGGDSNQQEMEIENANDRLLLVLPSSNNDQDAQSSSEKNDNNEKAAPNSTNNNNNGPPPAMTTMERRTSKRQRTSTSTRFEPGEGGGLAWKKSKGASNGTNSPEPGDSNLAPSASPSSLKSQGASNDGEEKRNETNDDESHRQGGNTNNDATMENNPGPQEWSEPSYHWIDDGVKNSDTSPSSVEHTGLEIDFTNSKTAHWTPPPPFVVRPGDVLLLSSGDTPWNNEEQQQQQSVLGQQQQGGGFHDNDDQKKHETVPIYNDPASREAGLGALDPYIGYVERLWEETVAESADPKKGTGQRKKKGSGKSANNIKSTAGSKSSTMMVRTRWFFKKENVGGLKGSFVIDGGTMNAATTTTTTNHGGNAKSEILASMNSQDLVLTDISDDNAVSTILGKIRVVKRKPLEPSKNVEKRMSVPKGAHVCRYDISFDSSQSAGKEGTVKFFPCSDDREQQHGVSFQAGTENDTNGKPGEESKEMNDSSDPTSTDEDGDASLKPSSHRNDNYARPFSALPFPMSPRRLVSEGATTVGKIKIGANHQATIPPQLDLQRKSSFRSLAHPPSQRIPIMLWDPATDEGDTVDGYLEEACSLLTDHLKLIQLEPFHIMNDVEAPNTDAEIKKPREISIDRLLTELHECKGDAGKAIKKISGNPEKYMTIWTNTDKEQFDQGYRTYRESIRMIVNSLGPTKSCKDAVDYQYRFKLVENFRRFKMKKREKAEEIMATVEDRMLNEKVKVDARSQEAIETDVSSSEEEGKAPSLINSQVGTTLTGVPATQVGPVNNRVRTWFRTGGGGEDAIGAAQQRRNTACDLLSQIMEKVGKDAYFTLAKSLKVCNSSMGAKNSLTDVKSIATDVMKAHPDLLEQFITFLPKEVRSS